MKNTTFKSKDILSLLPNKYPFIMIDHVNKILPGKSAQGYKTITTNDWFFQNISETNKIIPQSIQLECLEEMLIISMKSKKEFRNLATRFISAESKFYNNISPGNQLDLYAKVNYYARGILKGSGYSKINNKIICEATMVVSFPEIINKYLPQ